MLNKHIWTFLLLTLCMALIGSLLLLPMSSVAMGEPPSFTLFVGGLWLVPFAALMALRPAAWFSAITLASVFLVDRRIPLRDKLKSKPSQITAIGILTLLVVSVDIGLTLIVAGDFMKNAWSSFFTFAIPAALAAAALGPWIISRVCRTST